MVKTLFMLYTNSSRSVCVICTYEGESSKSLSWNIFDIINYVGKRSG